LNFQDIDVRSVLQLLADTSGQNIVVSDSVTGNLTLRLQNVPWDQALDIVLRTKGWTSAARTMSSSSARPKNWPRARRPNWRPTRKCRSCRPVHTEFMQVNYAKVVGPGEADQDRQRQGLHAVAARQPVGRRAHQHLVGAGHRDKLQDIRRLVQTLDVPVKQVLIEARIVIVSDTFERDLGARFGVTGFTTAAATTA
jgi:type IV pilus assembly protein PilQ